MSIISPQNVDRITHAISTSFKTPLDRVTLLLQLQEDKDLKQVKEQIEENEGKFGYLKNIFQIILLELAQKTLESYLTQYSRKFMNMLFPKKGYSPWRSFFKKIGMISLTTAISQLFIYPFVIYFSNN